MRWLVVFSALGGEEEASLALLVPVMGMGAAALLSGLASLLVAAAALVADRGPIPPPLPCVKPRPEGVEVEEGAMWQVLAMRQGMACGECNGNLPLPD